MSIHLSNDLTRLKKEILTLGSMVEESINKSILALVNRRAELCNEVIEGDVIIDNKEMEVEDACLKILALHQPVAGDLRYIITVLKVNNYLERMADMACNIAERAEYLSTHDVLDIPDNFLKMAELVKIMTRESLDALVNKNAEQARALIIRDDEIDSCHASVIHDMMKMMIADSKVVKRSFSVMSVSYQLERIADLANNICEDVVFMVDAEVIRHRGNPYLDEKTM